MRRSYGTPTGTWMSAAQRDGFDRQTTAGSGLNRATCINMRMLPYQNAYTAQSNRRHGRGRQPSTIRNKFIKGPLDFVWLSEARKLGVTALWVGLSLWFLRGLRRSNSFMVSNLMMQEWGVQPDAKARALRALEKAGLYNG
jgi:hypothetical protein